MSLFRIIAITFQAMPMILTRQITLIILLLVGHQALHAQGDDFVFYSDLAQNWYEGGAYFE
jgi:predicted solute-binding protein